MGALEVTSMLPRPSSSASKPEYIDQYPLQEERTSEEG